MIRNRMKTPSSLSGGDEKDSDALDALNFKFFFLITGHELTTKDDHHFVSYCVGDRITTRDLKTSPATLEIETEGQHLTLKKVTSKTDKKRD